MKSKREIKQDEDRLRKGRTAWYSKLESGDYEVHVNGRKYVVEKWYDVTPVGSIRFDRMGQLVCDRKRDFGGIGKDAMKLETNVPVSIWLMEVRAIEVEA